MTAVQDLARRGLPLKTIIIGKPLQKELILSDVKAASTAMQGETLPVEATLEATDAGVVALTVTDASGEEAFAREIAVTKGSQTLDLTLPLKQRGTTYFNVRVNGKKDTLASNNQKQFAVEVLAPYSIGLIGTSEAVPLDKLLKPSAAVKMISLQALEKVEPSQENPLNQYDLIVLADTPASQLGINATNQLIQAVQNGCGLLVTGGKRSFGPGGYLDGPLAKVLPVRSIQKMEQRDPSATLVIIIDTSGSMGGARVQLAKEIARLAIKRLKPHDKAGVVEFYGSKRWAAPIQPASNAIDINRALNRLSSGGGTVILPAIEEAYFALLNVRTRTKHVLVLTDGGIETGAFEPLIRKMADRGMTLSTVLVGPSTHSTFLTRLAQWGRGKSYHAPSRFNLPEILIKQPESSLLSPWIERATQMTLEDRSVLTNSINFDHAPLLTGYVETEARPTADVLIGSALDHPILVRWQYGLGHVATLTTQLAGKWSEDLVKWDGYGPLFSGLSRSLARRTDRMPIQFTCTVGPEGLTIFAKSTTLDTADNAASLELTATDLLGESVFQETLEPVQPGQWLTRIPLNSIVASHNDSQILHLEAKTSTDTLSSGAVVVRASDEFCTIEPEATSMANWEKTCQEVLTQKNKEKGIVASQADSPVELRSIMIILSLILFFVQVTLRRVLPGRRFTVNAPKNLATSATAVLVLFLTLLATTSSAATKKSTENLLPNDVVVKSQALYQKGETKEASSILKKAVTAATKDVSAHAARLAWLYGDSKTASELLVPDPRAEGKTRCREELLLGTVLLETDQSAKSMKHFQRAYEYASTPTDRRFAMAMQIHAARKAGKLDRLADQWFAEKELPKEQIQALIQILGELDRHEDAFKLVERPGLSEELSVSLQKEVVSLAIDAGKTERAMAVYHQLLEEHPRNISYLSAAARLYLLEDRRQEAIKLFQDAIEATEVTKPKTLLRLADAAADLALYEQAEKAMDKAAKHSDVARIKSMIKKVDLVRRAGDPDKALDMLASIRPLLDDHPKQLLAVAEAYDRYGDHVEAFSLLKVLYEKTKSEDILAQVAWLSEESGEMDEAYKYWVKLWRQTKVPARRRHAKTRMLDLASRNGKLIDMVLDIEEKLDVPGIEEKLDKDQDMREEVLLLVDIYSQTNDAISASEILFTFGQKKGKGKLDVAKRLVRVYIDCELFARANAQLYKLVKMDPEHAADYYEQIAMLAVERGRPYEALQVTKKLNSLKNAGNHAAEFSAGVYELLDMYDEAIDAYEAAYQKHPGHIEILLLWGRAMQKANRKEEAVQRFLDIAKTCEKDDQFVIAIDGLLNLEAGPKILKEALSLIERRLAADWNKVFYYDLSCDLLDNLGEPGRKLRLLQQSLIAAGMRRPTVLRQLMDEATTIGNSTEENIVVDYGRILLALGDEVPPSVFLQIGQAMLNANDVKTAATIFRRAGVHGGFADIGRRVAQLYETAGKAQQAESMLHELLITEPDAIDLLIQAGGLSEQTGHFGRAFDSYSKAANLLMDRVPPVVRAKQTKPTTGRYRHYRRSYNLSEVELYLDHAIVGLVNSARTPERQTHMLDSLLKQTEQELADLKKQDNLKETLEENPRLARRISLLRRVAFALHRPTCAAQIDRVLVTAYPKQKDLLDKILKDYVDWGFFAAAYDLGELRPSSRKIPTMQTYWLLKDEKEIASCIENPNILSRKASEFIPAMLAKGRVEDVRKMFSKLSKTHYLTNVVYVTARVLDDSETLTEWAKKRIKTISPSAPRADTMLQNIAELAWPNFDDEVRKEYLKLLDKMIGKSKTGKSSLRRLRLELTAQGDQFMKAVAKNDDVLKSLMSRRSYRGTRNLESWFSAMPTKTRIRALQLGCKVNAGQRQRGFLLEVLKEVDSLNDVELTQKIVELFKKTPPMKLHEKAAYHQLTPAPWYRLNSSAGKAAAAEIADQLLKDHPSEPCVTALHAMAMARQFSGPNAKKPTTASKEALEARKLMFEVIERMVSRKSLGYQDQRFMLDTATVLPESDIKAFEELLDKRVEKSGMTVSIAFAQYCMQKRLGNTEKALGMLKTIFELAPGERTSSYAYFTVMKRLGRDAELADILGESAHAASAESSHCQALSEAYGRLYRFDDAIRVARQDTSTTSPIRLIGLEAAGGSTEGVLREIRRFLIQGRKSRMHFYGSGFFQITPGGMREFLETPQNTSMDYRNRKGVYELLADQPFAVEEWKNMLRAATSAPSKMDNLNKLVSGYAKALVLAGKAKEEIEAIHARHARGVSDKKDMLLLLSLLSELPMDSKITVDKSLPELDEMLFAVHWSDRQQVTKLARALFKAGRVEESRYLFRWAIASSQWGVRNEFRYSNVWETVDGLIETYPKEERAKRAFEILKQLKPTPLSVCFSDVHEEERFKRLLPLIGICPEVKKELRKEADDFRERINRAQETPSKNVLATLAALEASLDRTDAFQKTIQKTFNMEESNRYRAPAFFDCRRFLPPAKAMKNPEKHLKIVLQELKKRNEANDLRNSEYMRSLCLLGNWQATNQVKTSALRDVIAKAAKRMETTGQFESDPATTLWLIDYYDQTGDIDAAYQLSKRLLENRCYPPSRFPWLFAEIKKRENKKAYQEAIKIGKSYSKHPILTAK
ncbi:MAG: VWA domain-containing protein [Planctomycetia bacterium]